MLLSHHLEDLQNPPIIFDNHSITLCSKASIMTTRETCLSAFEDQTASLYARKLAEPGYIALAFDASFRVSQ